MVTVPERDMYATIDFEETELRLGLPGAKGGGEEVVVVRKRGFSETVDLKLNLSSSTTTKMDGGGGGGDEGTAAMMKSNEGDDDEKMMMNSGKEKLSAVVGACDPAKPPPPKAQVVGWPPIRSFRKNVMAVQKTNNNNNNNDESSNRTKNPAATTSTTTTSATTTPTAAATTSTATPAAAFVKVSVDGAPYLRKVDLKLYKSYSELSDALGKMFSSFTIGNCGPNGMKDFMSESKLVDLLSGSEYVPSYEDKDGDWMLVGDVPWEMFVGSCKRLRIMKGSEAIGLAPRAVEKCKNRC